MQSEVIRIVKTKNESKNPSAARRGLLGAQQMRNAPSSEKFWYIIVFRQTETFIGLFETDIPNRPRQPPPAGKERLIAVTLRSCVPREPEQIAARLKAMLLLAGASKAMDYSSAPALPKIWPRTAVDFPAGQIDNRGYENTVH